METTGYGPLIIERLANHRGRIVLGIALASDQPPRTPIIEIHVSSGGKKITVVYDEACVDSEVWVD